MLGRAAAPHSMLRYTIEEVRLGGVAIPSLVGLATGVWVPRTSHLLEDQIQRGSDMVVIMPNRRAKSITLVSGSCTEFGDPLAVRAPIWSSNPRRGREPAPGCEHVVVDALREVARPWRRVASGACRHAGQAPGRRPTIRSKPHCARGSPGRRRWRRGCGRAPSTKWSARHT